MVTDSSDSNPQPVIVVPLNPTQNLITINAATQLLTHLNYFSWKAQFNALFFGLGFLGYLDGTLLCLSPTIDKNG